MAALQKVGLVNSMTHCCNQVRPEELGSGRVVSVTYLVSIHLNDLDRGEDIVLNQVVELQVSA